MQREPKERNINVIAKIVTRHAPDLVSNDYATIVIDHVVSFQAQRQVKLANKRHQWEPLEEGLVELSKLEEKLSADGHYWIEIVIIASSILNSEWVEAWESPQVTANWLFQVENFAKDQAKDICLAHWHNKAPWAAIMYPLKHEYNE